MSDFAGRHVLVTGASTGIGFAAARSLAERGARVSMFARTASKLAESAAIVGGEALPVAVDVGDRVSLLAAVDSVEGKFGPVSGLFANAGIGGKFAPLVEYADDVFDEVLRTNLTSVYWLLKRVMRGMIDRQQGSIVITGSLASERGMPSNVGYVVSKHAVLGLARAAAIEGAAYKVRVNCLLPGLIETPMLLNLDPGAEPESIRAALGKNVPMGRIGTADEAAKLATFLLSDDASHITAQSIAVDGGILGTLKPA